MHGFRGNHRSAERGKKGRKIKAYHHDEACKCSAPFLKLHYNDCPVLTKPCPIHGHLRSLKQDKSEREQNVAASNNPSSKTEKLFRPVKSLLNVRDPETRFSFRHCSPKNSSSHESVKPRTDSDNFKMNLNKLFVEKAKPFVAEQTNKIKKLKQCFHTPCNTILQKSRSHTFVKEKTGGVRRDFYTMMPEMPPDEKRCDIGFNWLPPGKFGFKGSEKKNDWVIVAGEESAQDFNKLFGGSCLSKGMKEIPIFGFPKEATQFVYSSFTYRDSRRKTEDKSPSAQRRSIKERRSTNIKDTSPSEMQTTSSDDSIYFAPFILRPTGELESEPRRPEVPKATLSTQTYDEMRKRLTVGLQTDQKECKDSEVQTGRLTFPAEDIRPREAEAVKLLRCEPESEETYPSAASEDGLETSVPETEPIEDVCVPRNVSYVIQTVSDNEAKESKRNNERGNQTSLACHDAEQATHSQQTSLHEELCNAVSDLTELKNIIYEYFKKAEPPSQASRAKVVDHETMTDSFLLKTSKKSFAHAESQTTQLTQGPQSIQESRPTLASRQSAAPPPAPAPAPAPQDFQCIEIEDLERAAVLCVCSLCGKEIQTFTVNIAASTESNAPLLEVIDKANAVDVYGELIEVKSKKCKNPDSGNSVEATSPPQGVVQKPKETKKKDSQDPARLAAYEMWNSSPSSSTVIKPDPPVCVNKTRQKSDTPSSQQNCRLKSGQSGKSVSPPPKDRQSRDTTRDCSEPRKSRKSSEFYYPVFIKPFVSKQFSKILERKIHENVSEDSDSTGLKQKRTYDKYFEATDFPAGKKIKQGFEHPKEYLRKESPSFSDLDRKKRDGKPLQKGFGLLLPLATDHFCGKHSLKKSKDRKPKDLSHVKSLSLGSLNNLFTAEGCRHLRPIPIGCDEQSFRELLESSTCKSVKLLKSNAEGVFFHPWPNSILAAYEADEGSMSSFDKKLPTTPSRENTPNEEEIYEECTCCRSSNGSNESNDTPDTLPMAEIVEETEERDWESHSRRPEAKTKGRKSRSFSAYPRGTNSECGGTFWFGRDHKRK